MHSRTAIPTHKLRDKCDQVRLMVYEYKQDDPRKCTAARLVHLHIAYSLHALRQIPRHSLVLNPKSSKTLTPDDKLLAYHHGIVALDCSWKRADHVFQHDMPGENRRLPSLLAANPTNYSAIGKLSTVEAISATLYILGCKRRSLSILKLFAWGPTFTALNRELLDAYQRNNHEETIELEKALMKRSEPG